MRVRPMRVEDLHDAGRVAAADGSDDTEVWERRAAHLLQHDAAGCWVAEEAGHVLGVVLSLRRELMWGLPVLAVLPDARGQGVGKALLEAALVYSRGCLRGVGLPRDGAGARRARLAGFHLHPTMRLTGVVDRSLLPVVEHVRDGVPGDLDLCDSVARQARGAAHGVDHEVLVREGYLLVCDTLTGSAFAYVAEGGPLVVAGTSRLVAQRVLWEALARSAPGSAVKVPHLTADQDWAVEVCLAAGLAVEPHGWVALRHMRPPAPYVPSTTFF
jgi:GNAT superfamily N-acetyltransferase